MTATQHAAVQAEAYWAYVDAQDRKCC